MKAEELYNTASSGLMENLKPEKYDLYKVMLDQEFIQHIFIVRKNFGIGKFGYIDVGDGCWRPNVLVTSLRCW